MNIDPLVRRLEQLTVPSADDGVRLVRTDRLDTIRAALMDAPYSCMGDVPLAWIFQHRAYRPDRPTILISNHIDSIYDNYFCSVDGGEIRGTFDNSACNAVAVELMLAGDLPAQALVAFTGDEEEDSAGVDQAVHFLQAAGSPFRNLEVVVALDVTEMSYGSQHFTIENYFIERHNQGSLLQFGRKREFKDYLAGLLDRAPVFVKDAEPDESWQYDEHDLNCFTFCLPCRVLGSDMHDDEGVAIRRDSLTAYSQALAQLTQGIDRDLSRREIDRRTAECP